MKIAQCFELCLYFLIHRHHLLDWYRNLLEVLILNVDENVLNEEGYAFYRTRHTFLYKVVFLISE